MFHPDNQDADARSVQRAQTRLGLGAMLIPLFFATMFALCIIGTYHRPDPNGIRFGVVGPAVQTAPLRADLEKKVGSAFDIRQVSTTQDAAQRVRERELDAAFLPSVDPRQPATVIVATGGGRLVAVAAETLGRSITSVDSTALAVRDVRPLASGDEIGIGVFMFMIVCTICGYLAVTLLFTVSPALEARRRYPMIVGISVLIPTVAYLVGGLGFGTYTGSFWTILGFIGVASLYTLVIGLVTRLLQVLLGPPALFVSLAIFVFLNIPSLGATYTATMLPSFWRFLNHFWIGAETTNAERSLLYYDGLGVGADLLRLLAWAVVVLALLSLPASRKQARGRNQHQARGQSPRATPHVVSP